MQMRSDWSSSWRITYLNTSTWDSWFCLKNSEHELYLLYHTYLKQKDGSRVIYSIQFGSALKTVFVHQAWHSYLNPWTSEGGEQGGLGLLDFENFSKKGCFHGFEREKTNFTTFSPLEKFKKNPLVPPLENILSTPIPESLESSLCGPQSPPERLAASSGTYSVMGVGKDFFPGSRFFGFSRGRQ